MKDILNDGFGQDITEYDFFDIFDLDEIQKFQDTFCSVMGVAGIITEPDGTPITQPSNFCGLCQNIIRKTEKGLNNCKLSDSIVGDSQDGSFRIQKCLSSGLIDGGISIVVNGKHIANWLIGQVIFEDSTIVELLPYADVIGINKAIYRNELLKVRRMSRLQFENVGRYLANSVQILSRYAVKNLEVKSLNEELERKIRKRTIELEEKNTLLNTSNTLFSAILESTKGVILFALNRNYNYITFNNNYQDVLLQAKNKRIGFGISILDTCNDSEEKARLKRNLDRALAGESFVVTEEYRDEGYTGYWQECFSPIFSKDNEVIGMTCFSIDLTEQKKAEQSLENSETKHKAMIANILDVIAIIDKDRIITYKSPNIKKLFGWEPEELVGLPYDTLIHPEDRERIDEDISRLLRNEKEFASLEFRYRCRDGSYREIVAKINNMLPDKIQYVQIPLFRLRS